MPVCGVCQSIDLFKLLENYKWSTTTGSSTHGRQLPHHETYAALRESAKTCPSCAIFYEPTNADPKYPNKTGIGEDDPVTIRLNRDYNYNSRVELIGALQFCVDVWSKSERHRGVISYNKYVDVWADGSESCWRYTDNALLTADTETGARLAAIILNRIPTTVDFSDLPFKWLEHCVVNHPGCRVKKRRLHDALLGETVPLPSRVVDVGPPDASQSPRLVETNGMRGTYLTLSHCWGVAGVMAKTLIANLEDRKKDIEIESLSANLRDAIITTRRLGFRYLWIDSLCIIQDSTPDWETEASRMAQIYNHSTMTISASRASSSDSGFLRETEDAPGFVAMTHPGNHGQYYLGKAAPESSSYLSDVERGPLNSRGWTLQERVLSRRSIFFGQNQMHWECQTARCSQSTQMEPQEFSEMTGGVSSLKSVLNLKTGSEIRRTCRKLSHCGMRY